MIIIKKGCSMNKVIKSHILFLFLIFGLFSTVVAMKKEETPQKQPQTIRQLMAARFVVFKQTINTGFSWIMEKINQFYTYWFSTPASSSPKSPSQTATHSITPKTGSPQQKQTQKTTQKFDSWRNIPKTEAIYFYDRNKPFFQFINSYK